MAASARVMKKVSAHVEPGEQLVTACACQPKGSLAAGALGGAIGMLIANRAGKGKRDESAAAGFPLASMMQIGVTDRRLIVASGNKLVGTVPAEWLASAEVLKKNAIAPSKIRIALTNGHAVDLEANRMTGPDTFVDAVNALIASRRT